LIGRDAFLVLDLSFHILNGVGGLHIEGDGLASESLDEDLHTTAQSEDEMKCGFLLDVVVAEGSAVLELLSGEDESLLVRWDSLLVLDLGLHVFDSVGWFDVQSDGLTSEGLHEDLHATSESQDEVESGFFLDVVVGEGSAIFELLASENESLLVGWNAFLVLDLGLDIFNGVGGLHIKSNSLSCEGFDEDLHVVYPR